MTDTQQEKPFKWVEVKSVDEMQAFYLSRIDAIRQAARECGYAIGLHGSTRRDLDLIAVPWVDEYKTRDELADAVARAACGLGRTGIKWNAKPNGRVATTIPICWAEWPGCYDIKSLGCIDLSIIPANNPEMDIDAISDGLGNKLLSKFGGSPLLEALIHETKTYIAAAMLKTKEQSQKVWLLLRNIPATDEPTIDGIYIHEQDAVSACTSDDHFICLVNINERVPVKAIDAEKLYYPTLEKWEESALYKKRNAAKAGG